MVACVLACFGCATGVNAIDSDYDPCSEVNDAGNCVATTPPVLIERGPLFACDYAPQVSCAGSLEACESDHLTCYCVWKATDASVPWAYGCFPNGTGDW